MQKSSKISTDELVQATGLTEGQIEYRISMLKKEDRIKRKGSKKSGEWLTMF